MGKCEMVANLLGKFGLGLSWLLVIGAWLFVLRNARILDKVQFGKCSTCGSILVIDKVNNRVDCVYCDSEFGSIDDYKEHIKNAS